MYLYFYLFTTYHFISLLPDFSGAWEAEYEKKMDEIRANELANQDYFHGSKILKN